MTILTEMWYCTRDKRKPFHYLVLPDKLRERQSKLIHGARWQAKQSHKPYTQPPHTQTYHTAQWIPSSIFFWRQQLTCILSHPEQLQTTLWAVDIWLIPDPLFQSLYLSLLNVSHIYDTQMFGETWHPALLANIRSKISMHTFLAAADISHQPSIFHTLQKEGLSGTSL